MGDQERKPLPRLLSTADAAKLLNVSTQTILNWIEQEEIPYLQLPGGSGKRRKFRIPLRGLLESLSGNYDLGKELDEMIAELGLEDQSNGSA